MKFKTMLLVAGATALAGILPVIAADEKPPTIARHYELEVMPGQEALFEAGMKKQIEWYKNNNETWQWHTWKFETGEKTGQYAVRSPGHYWKDLDDRSERTVRATAHFKEKVKPYVESMQASILKALPDVSNWPDDLGEIPMVSVYEFNIHYGMSEDFVKVIGKINGAIKESNWGVNYAWVARESGGEVPTFFLVIPRKNWADMEGPEKPLWTMLEETLGKAEAAGLKARRRKCVRKQSSALARFHPELSYFPPGEG